MALNRQWCEPCRDRQRASDREYQKRRYRLKQAARGTPPAASPPERA
jgi:hypothetical protein